MIRRRNSRRRGWRRRRGRRRRYPDVKANCFDVKFPRGNLTTMLKEEGGGRLVTEFLGHSMSVALEP